MWGGLTTTRRVEQTSGVTVYELVDKLTRLIADGHGPKNVLIPAPDGGQMELGADDIQVYDWQNGDVSVILG